MKWIFVLAVLVAALWMGWHALIDANVMLGVLAGAVLVMALLVAAWSPSRRDTISGYEITESGRRRRR